MQGIPLHPIFVHIPVGLSVVFPILAFGLTLALWRGLLTQRAWVVAIGLQALLLAGGLAALKTGEKEEDLVEDIVGEQRVKEHEERAEAFLWSAGVTLALSGTVLVLGPGVAVAAAGATTAASLVTLGFAYRVGHSGGELVYKYGAASAYATPAVGGGNGGGGERRTHGDHEEDD
jgi:uncharacterized membrane protein